MLLNFEDLKVKFGMDISGVCHIGAHHGQEFQIYQRNDIRNVVFFEPLPDTFRILQENLKDTDVVLVNLALGNENKTVRMFVETANSGQSSSILEPALHLEQYPHIQFPDRIDVKMVRLDDFLQTTDRVVGGFNMLVIDVQGYELEVFKGAATTLHGVDYVICEVNRDEMYKGCPMVTELDSFLETYGFSRVETAWAGGTWGDALYVKDRRE